MSRRRYMTKKVLVDPKTLLLLHAEDFTDSSTFERSVTVSGAMSSDSGKFGKCFNIDNGNITVDLPIVKDNTSVFTIDFWGYLTDTQINAFYAYPIAFGVIGLSMNINAAYVVRNGNTYFIQVTGLGLNIGWHHVAVIIEGKSMKLFIDGSLRGSYNGSLTTTYAPQLNVGYVSPSGTKIDEFRVSNIARWTSNFTPPSSPYQPD